SEISPQQDRLCQRFTTSRSCQVRTTRYGDMCGPRVKGARWAFPPGPSPLPEHVGDRAGADRPAALADGEAEPRAHRDGLAELDGHLDRVARHRHAALAAEVDAADHVGGAEVELRPVTVEERPAPPAL